MAMQHFDPNSMTLDHDPNVHERQFGGDDKLFVQFYEHFVKDEQESIAKARPIYNPATFIKIITPGNRDNIIERPVTDHDKYRFATRFERYKKGVEGIGSGTRLEEWPLIARSMTEELKFLGFYTVEQIAEAPDAAMEKVPGLRALKDRASAWIKAASDAEFASRTAEEVKKKDETIGFLQKQIDELKLLVAKAPMPDGAQDVAKVATGKGTKVDAS